MVGTYVLICFLSICGSSSIVYWMSQHDFQLCYLLGKSQKFNLKLHFLKGSVKFIAHIFAFPTILHLKIHKKFTIEMPVSTLFLLRCTTFGFQDHLARLSLIKILKVRLLSYRSALKLKMNYRSRAIGSWQTSPNSFPYTIK